MSRLTVTAVIAVLNGASLIRRALDSIMRQTRPVDDILVVDGHSTDTTVAVALFCPRVRVVQQPGTGIPDAYNAGIDEAHTDLLAFLSHDDEWTPEKIERQIACFEADDDLQVSTSRVRFVADDPADLPPGFRPELLRGDHPAHIMETLMARRQAFKSVGPFRGELPVAHDVDWFARARDMDVKWAFVDEVLLRKHVHDGNVSLHSKEVNADLLAAVRASIARKRSGGGGGR
jgi:glycosyltransferase involved in cell wall biosynthesis